MFLMMDFNIYYAVRYDVVVVVVVKNINDMT